jgi:hypothetical protein
MRTRADCRTNAPRRGVCDALQQLVETVGTRKLEFEVTPWGDGYLKINGLEVATIKGRATRRQAFRDLRRIAEHYPALDS